jgi:tetratricopeptide (TPR) repeat protein
MRQAVARALELDPDLAEGQLYAVAVQRDSWEFAAADRDVARTLAAHPKNIDVLLGAAYHFLHTGRVEEAIALEEKALEADPLNLRGIGNLANTYRVAGRLDEAEALLGRLLELKPDHGAAYGILSAVRLQRGDVEGARAAQTRANELLGRGDRGRLFSDAIFEHAAGNASAAAAAAAEFEKRYGTDDPLACAGIRAWRGEADLAFAWLDKAYALRDPALTRVRESLYLRSLHADPRWRRLLEKIGLPAG